MGDSEGGQRKGNGDGKRLCLGLWVHDAGADDVLSSCTLETCMVL